MLTLCPFGCLNVHASLLPRHRGASPISAAILAGDRETGVSFMRMDEGLDTGPVYDMRRHTLKGQETALDLEDRLAGLAAAHAAECIWRVAREGLQPVAQAAEGAVYAPKLRKKDGEVDWRRSAEAIERQTRALTPWPRAYSWLRLQDRAQRIQITAAAVVPRACKTQPGEVIQADKHAWIVACGGDALRLIRVIPEGRGDMDAAAFLRGCPVPVASRLGSEICERAEVPQS